MVIRSLVIATLLAGAASAHATPTSSTTVLGGWTLQSGSVSVVGSLDSAVASGNWEAFSQAWNMHTSLTSKGDAVGSAMLFAPNATGARAGGGGAGGSGGAGGGADGGAGAGGGGAGGGGAGGGGAVGGGAGGSVGDGGGSVGGGTGGGTEINVPGAGGGLENDLPVRPGDSTDAIAAEVPEPSSIALLLAGLAGAGFVSRRRSK